MTPPLSPEEESDLREVVAMWPAISMESVQATFQELVRRLLATLDAEREKWDGLSARVVEAEAAERAVRNRGAAAWIEQFTDWVIRAHEKRNSESPSDPERLRLAAARVVTMFGRNPKVIALGGGYDHAIEELMSALNRPESPSDPERLDNLVAAALTWADTPANSLADPVWRVAEAAREVVEPLIGDAGGDRWWAALDALRAALADLDAKVERTK